MADDEQHHQGERFSHIETELNQVLAQEFDEVAISRLRHIAKMQPELYWRAVAKQYLDWQKPFDQAMPDHQGQPLHKTWFKSGKLNLTENCIDRHLINGLEKKTALIWIGENGEKRLYTYWELHQKVCQTSAALKNIGIQKGDVISLYIPILPEAVIAMLSCARIGAIHCNTFWGFSASILSSRLQESKSKMLITANGAYRQRKKISIANIVMDAVKATGPQLKTVVWVDRLGEKLPDMGRETIEWTRWTQQYGNSELIPPETLESEHPAFIVFTSGTSGRPQKIIHRLGGFSIASHISCKMAFGLRKNDIIWCTADIGWITSHSHVVYGPLSNGVTSVIYEGHVIDEYHDKPWALLEDNKVNVWKTSPSVLRMMMAKQGLNGWSGQLPELRVVLSSGEPLTLDVWRWFNKQFNKQGISILDGWGQTETAGTLICQSPHQPKAKGLCVGRELPGASVSIKVNLSTKHQKMGELLITGPWPGIADTTRPISPEQPMKTGDAAAQYVDGSYRILGRIDDVVNIAGHRIALVDIEMAIKDHQAVSDTCVVGVPNKIKGQTLVAHIELKDKISNVQHLLMELNESINKKVSRIVTPITYNIMHQLPRTATGKIARGKLREISLESLKSEKFDNYITDVATFLNRLIELREQQ